MIEYTEIDVEFLGETESAIKVTDGDITCWIPKSIITNYDEDEDYEISYMYTFTIPEWFAIEKGLI
jgi:hypothetical protein